MRQTRFTFSALATLGLMLLTGCVHSFSGGARAGVSPQGDVRLGVPVSMALPIPIDDVADRRPPAHVFTIGVAGSLEAFFSDDSASPPFMGTFTPFMQYLSSGETHSAGFAVRGGAAIGDNTTAGLIGIDFLYRVEVSGDSIPIMDGLLYSRNQLGLSLGLELATSGLTKEDHDPKLFFLLGVSWIYENTYDGPRSKRTFEP